MNDTIDYTTPSRMDSQDIDDMVFKVLAARYPRAAVDYVTGFCLYGVVRAERVVARYRVDEEKSKRAIPLVNRYGATRYWLVRVS